MVPFVVTVVGSNLTYSLGSALQLNEATRFKGYNVSHISELYFKVFRFRYFSVCSVLYIMICILRDSHSG